MSLAVFGIQEFPKTISEKINLANGNNREAVVARGWTIAHDWCQLCNQVEESARY